MTIDAAKRLKVHHKKSMNRARRQAGECLNNDPTLFFKNTKERNWEARYYRKRRLFLIEKELLIECHNIINHR